MTQATQTKYSIFELAQKLSNGEKLQLAQGESVHITHLDMTDFLAIANEDDLQKKLSVLQMILNRFNVALVLQGGIVIGGLNLDDRSWTLSAAENQNLEISGASLPLKLTVTDLVKFLKKLPLGQGIAFKANQDVILTGLSEQAVMNYFEFSQNVTDVKVLETAQDQFFAENCHLLRDEKLSLKLFALDAAQLNREVNPAFGMIAFKPVASDEFKQPKIAVALVKSEA